MKGAGAGVGAGDGAGVGSGAGAGAGSDMMWGACLVREKGGGLRIYARGLLGGIWQTTRRRREFCLRSSDLLGGMGESELELGLEKRDARFSWREIS